MADSYSYELHGIEELQDAFDEVQREFFRHIDKTLHSLAEKVALDARRLVGLDSGDLEAAIDFDEVVIEIANMYVDIGVVVSPEVAPYAWAQHEGFRKTKEGVVIPFSPGPKTLSKGPYKGFMPGKKYLANALTINEDLIIEKLAEAFSGGVL